MTQKAATKARSILVRGLALMTVVGAYAMSHVGVQVASVTGLSALALTATATTADAGWRGRWGRGRWGWGRRGWWRR